MKTVKYYARNKQQSIFFYMLHQFITLTKFSDETTWYEITWINNRKEFTIYSIMCYRKSVVAVPLYHFSWDHFMLQWILNIIIGINWNWSKTCFSLFIGVPGRKQMRIRNLLVEYEFLNAVASNITRNWNFDKIKTEKEENLVSAIHNHS